MTKIINILKSIIDLMCLLIWINFNTTIFKVESHGKRI